MIVLVSCKAQPKPYEVDEGLFVIHNVEAGNQSIRFFWKDESNVPFSSIGQLKAALLPSQDLVFAMNGGMYLLDQSPQGLYIENGELLSNLDTTQKGYGNFYMQPNGLFVIDTNYKAQVVKTADFEDAGKVRYATQSGPMLLINESYHPKFNYGSKNKHIRNGVGVKSNGDIVFAISKVPVNFYDFATLFKQNDCVNALYLDGFVSKAYLPEQNFEQLDGAFGVIIGQVQPVTE